MKTTRKEWENTLSKVILNKWFWIIFLVINFTYPIYRSINRELPSLPEYKQLPKFNLTDQNSKDIGSDKLKGKVYITSFIFSRCSGPCREILKKTQKMQKRLRGVGDKALLLTITVDPEYDTPSVLKKISKDYKSNPRIWSFATGSLDTIKNILNNGFNVVMQKTDGDLFDIVHSEKFILVDQKGTIRGYYSSDKKGIDKLLIDTGLLVNIAVK